MTVREQFTDARAAQIYEEGARRLAAAWDEEVGLIRHDTEYGVFHDARGSLGYAGVLLREGGNENVARAERIIRNVATMQETREQDEHFGNFRWFYEDQVVTDLNAVEFVLDGLNALLIEHSAAISDGSRAVVHEMIRLGLDEIDQLDVHPSYTNIALSDICNSVLGGQSIGAPEYIERGARRLDEWFEYTNRSGAPNEYNSPTYVGVDIARMAFLAEHASDQRIALKARVSEERLWLHTAAHHHPQLAQIAGPHSRSYRDGWTGSGGYLKLMLWRLIGDDNLRRPTPFFPRGREEGFLGSALGQFHCPDYVTDWLRQRRFPFESLETADVPQHADITTYMTASYALGTASVSYGVGEPPEHWPQPSSLLLYFLRDDDPGYGVLYTRYIVNDKGPGAIVHESNRTTEDHWEEGRFCGAQHRNRAIAAYGLLPRLRPVTSLKSSVRVLGVTPATAIWIGNRRVDAFPATVEPGEPVIVAEGGAYIAIIPLDPTDMGSDAPIELNVVDGQLMLEIYNYKGPAKTFWEHRSQGGPFFKGNVRNAFAIEVADKDAFPDADAFRKHIGAARVTDSVDDEYAREIVYASEGGSVALRYSLWDMSVIERKRDGVEFTPPMGRYGALDGHGPQWLQSRDSLIELAGATLMAGRTPKWLYVDRERGRYVFVNPSDEMAPLWIETPATIVECDAIGFARVDIDVPGERIMIEAADEIGSVRMRGPEQTRLFVNGADVTDAMTAAAKGVREFSGR